MADVRRAPLHDSVLDSHFVDSYGPCYDQRLRRLARKILPVLFAGQSVRCPCCERMFRRFVRRRPEQLLCPGCLSLGRHRAFWLFVSPQLKPGLRILHMAPEEGIAERLRSWPEVTYVTADADPGSIAESTFDITSIPFGDCSFDVALCNHVFEHVEDDRLAMRELLRVLEPGGFLYSMHPVYFDLEETVEDPAVTDPAERVRLFGQRDHLRRYGRDFIDRLGHAGFDVELERFIASAEEALLYGIKREEKIFVCRRPPTG